ncbi:hypothetical protein KA005_74195 [bacterium]|nr:hypothetical protein [bacterium]
MATEEKPLIEKASTMKAKAKEIQFGHFWAEHGARISFTLDGVEAMMSASHDAKEPLFFHVSGTLYMIPWHSIDNYFKTHTKPKPPMSQKEELAYWRKRAMELEVQVKGIKADETKLAKPAPDVPDEIPPEEEETKEFKVAEPGEAPEAETIVPPQDKSIPIMKKEDREKDRMSPTEIQEDIKADLKKKNTKGASNRDEKYLKLEPKAIPKVDEPL